MTKSTAAAVEQVRLTTSPARPPARAAASRTPDVLALLGVLALGVLVRVAVLRSPLGALNSDEATVGLMAQRILRGELPLVVAGNNYGGTLEPFLMAPVLAVTGASALALKVLPSLIWLLASGMLYLVAAPLLGRRPALVLAGVLWVFSFSMVLLSTMSYPGYSSGVVGCLAALGLMLREIAADQPARGVLRDRVLLGFVTGLTVWFHPMHIAFLLPAHVFVLLRLPRAGLGRWVLPNAFGAVAGALPMMLHLLQADPTTLEQQVQPPSAYGSRLFDFFRELLPRLISLQSSWDGAWTGGGLGVALFLALMLGFATAVLRLRRGSPPEQLIAWIAIAFPFLLAVFPTSWYYDDARYGVTYAAVILLVLGLTASRHLPVRRLPAQALFVVPFLWFALFCYPLIAERTGLPVQGGPDAQIPPLASALKTWGVTDVQADYWIGYRLAFIGGSDIAVTPFNNVRFPDDDRRVLAAGSDAGYVVPVGDWRDEVFSSSLPTHERRRVGDFAVFVPRPDG